MATDRPKKFDQPIPRTDDEPTSELRPRTDDYYDAIKLEELPGMAGDSSGRYHALSEDKAKKILQRPRAASGVDVRADADAILTTETERAAVALSIEYTAVTLGGLNIIWFNKTHTFPKFQNKILQIKNILANYYDQGQYCRLPYFTDQVSDLLAAIIAHKLKGNLDDKLGFRREYQNIAKAIPINHRKPKELSCKQIFQAILEGRLRLE